MADKVAPAGSACKISASRSLTRSIDVSNFRARSEMLSQSRVVLYHNPHTIAMSSAQADEDQWWRQFHGRWQDWNQLIVQVPLPALLVLFITLWWFVTRYQAPKKPPGPWAWPILGNLPTISSSKKLPHQTLRDLAAKYGGFMYLRLGMQVATTYDHICVDCEGGNSALSCG